MGNDYAVAVAIFSLFEIINAENVLLSWENEQFQLRIAAVAAAGKTKYWIS